MPAAAEFTPAVQVHQGLDAVLSTILRGQRREGGEVVTPNAEQSAFLRHFTTRLQLEAGEQRAGKINTARAEPLLDCVHGPPGTGISKYNSKLREMECKRKDNVCKFDMEVNSLGLLFAQCFLRCVLYVSI